MGKQHRAPNHPDPSKRRPKKGPYGGDKKGQRAKKNTAPKKGESANQEIEKSSPVNLPLIDPLHFGMALYWLYGQRSSQGPSNVHQASSSNMPRPT